MKNAIKRKAAQKAQAGRPVTKKKTATKKKAVVKKKATATKKLAAKKPSAAKVVGKKLSVAKQRTLKRKKAVVVLPKNYQAVLEAVKARIREAQLRAAQAVNTELVTLYWHIGKEIIERQDKEGWGSKVVERLAKDLHREFPGMGGFSERNLKYMRAFAEAYTDRSIVQQAVALIPWGHNVLLLSKVRGVEHRLWYAQATVANGWSRAVLDAQIATHAHRRQGKAITNFKRTLPADRSDLAQQTLKDPYTFEFLNIAAETRERDLEKVLVEHIQKVLVLCRFEWVKRVRVGSSAHEQRTDLPAGFGSC